MTDSDAVTTKQKESIATAEALAAARESRNLSQVDISPNLPPSSAWTAAAPAASGSNGGGRATPSRSMRVITEAPS